MKDYLLEKNTTRIEIILMAGAVLLAVGGINDWAGALVVSAFTISLLV